MQSYIELKVEDLNIIIPQDSIEHVTYSSKDQILRIKCKHENHESEFKGSDAISLYQQITELIRPKNTDEPVEVNEKREPFMPMAIHERRNTM